MRSLRMMLAAAFALGLVACSDDDGGQTNNNNHIMYQDSTVHQDVADQQDSSTPPQDSSTPHQDSSTPHQDSSTPGTGVTGDPCSVANQCGGITNGTPECLTSLMSFINFTGGYCSSQSCTEGSPCDNGTGTCVSIVSGIAKACLKACTSATECRQSDGYDCTSLPIGPTGTFCLPGGGMSFDGGMPSFDGGFP